LSVSSNLLVTSLPVSVAGATPGEDGAITLRFDPEPHHFPIIAELLMHDMTVVREQRALRQRPKSIIAGSLRILRWAITCPLAAIGVALGGKPDDKAEPQRLKPLAGAAIAAAPARHREAGE
jgi:cellulose synthase (UDP-forming)